MSNKNNLYPLYEALLNAVPEQMDWFEEFELNLANPEFKTKTALIDVRQTLQNLIEIGWLKILSDVEQSNNIISVKIICPPTYGLQKFHEFQQQIRERKEARRLSREILKYQRQEDERLLPKLWQSDDHQGKNPTLLYCPPTDASLLTEDLLIGRREIVLNLKNRLEENHIVSLVSQFGQLGVGKTKIVGWLINRLLNQKNSNVDIYWVKLGSQVSTADTIIDFLLKIKGSMESKQRTDYVSTPAPQVFQEFIDALKAHAYLIIIDNLDKSLDEGKPKKGMQLLLKMLMENPIGNSRVILINDQLPREQTVPPLQVPPFSEEETRQFLFDQDVPFSQQEFQRMMEVSEGNPLALKLGRRQWLNKEYDRLRPVIKRNPAEEFIHNAFAVLDPENHSLIRVVAALAKSEDSTLSAIKSIMSAYQGWKATDVESRLDNLSKTQLLLTKNEEKNKEPVYGMHTLIKEHVLANETSDDEAEEIYKYCMEYFLKQADQENSEDPFWLSAALHAFFGEHYQQLSAIVTERLSTVFNVEGSFTAFLDNENFTRGTVAQWKKSVCRFCGVGCGIMLGISPDEKLVAVRGDKDHPTTKGMLCGKALALPRIVTSRDRLTTPQIRRNGTLEKATWEEAMALVADKFAKAIDEHGRDSIAYYGSGQALSEETYLAARLFRGGIGTNNVDGNPRLCMASAVGGYMTSYGLDEPMGSYDDIEYAQTFFLIGSNIAECHPVIWYLIRQELLNDKSKSVITVDPRLTPKVDKYAKIHLNLEPGSDVQVLNAMAYVIINEGLHDQDFIDRHTVFYRQDDVAEDEKRKCTFAEYKSFLEDYAPEKIEDSTGLPADKIIEAARLFAQGPTISMWSMGLNQHRTGVWGNNLVHNLHLLTGNIGKPGATPLSLTGQPNACGGVRDGGALAHLLPYGRLVAREKDRGEMEDLWGIEQGRISAKPGHHTMSIFEAMATGELKAVLVLTTNPGQSLPNLNRHREAMQNNDSFMVVLDAYPTKTTAMADVVLPASIWSEKEGVYGMTERRYQIMPKVLEPLKGTRSDLEILLELAERLEKHGMVPEGFIHGKFKNAVDVWEEMRKISKDTAYDFTGMTRDRLHLEHGITWPVPTEDHPGTKTRYVKGQDPLLDAGPLADDTLKEGEIKFYGNPADDNRAIIWLRPVNDPELPDDKYPYALTTGRVLEHWHTGSMTMKAPELRRAKPTSFVEINTADAEELGLKEGDRVRIISRRGKAIIRTEFVDSIRPGTVFVPFHWDDEDSMINLVTIDAIDPISKQPEYKVCAVRLEKA